MLNKNNILILLSYFLVGASSLTGAAIPFFYKDVVTLSAAQLMSIGIWTYLPWSAKILFSSVIDSIPIAGSQRKAYLLLAGLFGILSSLGMVDAASGNSLLFQHLGEYATLLILGLLGSTSIVIIKLLLDVLIVENSKNDLEKAKFQLFARNSYLFGGLIGAIMSGFLASTFSLSQVFALSLISPIAVFLVALISKFKEPTELGERNLIGLALAFVTIITLLGFLLSDTSGQIAVFVVSLGLFGWLLSQKVTHLNFTQKLGLFTTLTALFLFRCNPTSGVASSWYFIDVHNFDAQFQGLLNIIGYGATVLGMLVFNKILINKDKIVRVLIFSTVGLLIFNLPEILIFYDLAFGISAKHLMLIDSTGTDILSQVAMIPLGVLVALHAPDKGKVTYLALVGSLMNLALMLAGLMQKTLNTIYVVERGNYEQLGHLMLAATGLSVILSILGIILLKTAKVFAEKAD